ncbi:MAG: hypothetical protein VB050_17940 [Geobacteraceae bacterium]|nr:hypothetical protein [Geobacteraceae bacterium]
MNARYSALAFVSFLALLHSPLFPAGNSHAEDLSGGQQRVGLPADQSQQIQQQPPQQQPDQQTPVGQPQVQQGLPQQQTNPDQSVPGGQPMMQPGQMMAVQSSCTVKISSDRTVISLMEAGSPQARDHISINPDRVQKVLTSPDGNWSLVMFKVRGENSYGAIPVDLAKCEVQEYLDIPAVTDNAQFDGETVTLVYPDGMQKKLSLRGK